MMKKVLLIETTLVSAFIAAFFQSLQCQRAIMTPQQVTTLRRVFRAPPMLQPHLTVYIIQAKLIPSLNNLICYLGGEQTLSFFLCHLDFARDDYTTLEVTLVGCFYLANRQKIIYIMVWFVSWKLFTYNLFTPDIYNF